MKTLEAKLMNAKTSETERYIISISNKTVILAFLFDKIEYAQISRYFWPGFSVTKLLPQVIVVIYL